MPFNPLSFNFRRSSKSSRPSTNSSQPTASRNNGQNQTADAGTSYPDVLYDHPLSQAQALHQAETILAQVPVHNYAQPFSVHNRAGDEAQTQIVRNPEDSSLPPPQLHFPTPSGLNKRRGHHARNPCGLSSILKPAVLVDHAPFWHITIDAYQELLEDIRLAQYHALIAPSTSATREARPNPAETAERALGAQLKSPNQGRIPDWELKIFRENTLELYRNAESDGPDSRFSDKEKVALRKLRHEVAKFPHIRAEALAVRPELETHPLYCTEEHLQKFGFYSWCDNIEDESDPTAPVLTGEQENLIVAASHFQEASNGNSPGKGDGGVITPESVAANILSNELSCLDRGHNVMSPDTVDLMASESEDDLIDAKIDKLFADFDKTNPHPESNESDLEDNFTLEDLDDPLGDTF